MKLVLGRVYVKDAVAKHNVGNFGVGPSRSLTVHQGYECSLWGKQEFERNVDSDQSAVKGGQFRCLCLRCLDVAPDGTEIRVAEARWRFGVNVVNDAPAQDDGDLEVRKCLRKLMRQKVVIHVRMLLVLVLVPRENLYVFDLANGVRTEYHD